ncbi:MAG: holo-ACP synthase [Holosporales bacterium]|nr:holo-ACP synthase [Holosporales bacterium]
MIIGVGVDIVDIRRIECLIHRYQDRFLKKVFSEGEIDFCIQRSGAVASFAKMFSLKEATVKAISDFSGVRWRDIEITHDSLGKPMVSLFGNALKNLQKRGRNFLISASVSDEKNYATAFVLIENAT